MLEVYDELFEQFFLFHKDIFMGFFLSWEDEYIWGTERNVY